MRVTPYGAAGEVTGSAYLVESDSASVLIDCGMFQGSNKSEARNRQTAQGKLDKVDAIVLTHAHLDHVGRLPILVRHGYSGPIYATPATIDLAELILLDAARIQENDTERENRKRERAGKALLEPLYTVEDAEATLRLMRTAPYDDSFEVAPGILAEMIEAGHMLGSVSIRLAVRDGEQWKVVVFSGDIGRDDMLMLRDAETFGRAKLVFLESTYGDRDHRSMADSVGEFWGVMREAHDQGGKILVPAFAVGRTQEILYCVAGAFRNQVVPPFPVYLDSPMAIKATRIYAQHPELMDEEARALIDSGQLAKDLNHVVPTETAAESIALNDMKGPMMVVSASGMMTGGRILHHLRHNLWRPETVLVIVGYQALGTLGRVIVDGADRVKIFGEWVAVKAKVLTVNGFSGHAGQSSLLRWLEPAARMKPKVALTHGEDRARIPLAALIEERYGIEPILPQYRDTITV